MEKQKDKNVPDHGIMKLVLTSFLGAQVTDVMNENGSMEKCVCIPIDRNGLSTGRTGKVSAYAFVNKTINSNVVGWSHFFVLKSSPEWARKIKELGYKQPVLGNMKKSNYIYDTNAYYKRVHEERRVKVSD